jgi:hypothetical protein
MRIAAGLLRGVGVPAALAAGLAAAYVRRAEKKTFALPTYTTTGGEAIRPLFAK